MKKQLAAAAVSAVLFGSTCIPMNISAEGNMTNYKVVAGDSLWKISQTFKVSVSDLKTWNGLSSDIINIGQTLKVAPIYIVVAGDTLWSISKKYNTTVDDLMKLNNLTSSNLSIGQAIKFAATSTSVSATSPSSAAPSAPVIQTVNYKIASGDTLWALSQKYKTSVDAIMKSNDLVLDYVMPNQILTIPVNSTAIVKPVGITMMKARTSDNYGDIYTWENAMRIWTVGTVGTLRDLSTGKTFNIRYYGGSNHSDIVPVTQSDTNVMQSIYGTWSWNNSNKRPMVLTFTKSGVKYQMAVSLTGMPHSTTDNTTNGMNGHCDMYFYNSVGHDDPVIDPVHQANVLKANGQ